MGKLEQMYTEGFETALCRFEEECKAHFEKFHSIYITDISEIAKELKERVNGRA